MNARFTNNVYDSPEVPQEIYPLVNIQKAIEAMAREIVDFPINSMVIFHSFLYVYQAGYWWGNHLW